MPRLTFPLVAGAPLVDLQIASASPHPGAGLGMTVIIPALIDTGAKLTCVDASALNRLGITPARLTAIRTASTGRLPFTSAVYDVSLTVPGPPAVALTPGVGVTAIDLSWSRYKCLVGRDVLGACRFVYDGRGGRFELEF